MMIGTVLVACGLYLKTASRYKEGGNRPGISYFHSCNSTKSMQVSEVGRGACKAADRVRMKPGCAL